MPYRAPNHTLFRVRSLYRSILRELLARPSTHYTILSEPSPLQRHIRQVFTKVTSQYEESADSKGNLHMVVDGVFSELTTRDNSLRFNRRFKEGEQYLQYLQAQRKYLTLLERYNPGANMGEEERVRLTARRVGLELPDDEP